MDSSLDEIFDASISNIISFIIANGPGDGRAKSETARAIAEMRAHSAFVDRAVESGAIDDIADALVDVVGGQCNIEPIAEFLAECSDMFIIKLFATASWELACVLTCGPHARYLRGIADLREQIKQCSALLEKMSLAPSL